MISAISLALIVGGCVLFIHETGGVRSSGPALLRLFTRPRAEQETFVLLAGVVAVIIGGISFCRGMNFF